jgi:hypothetical protein
LTENHLRNKKRAPIEMPGGEGEVGGSGFCGGSWSRAMECLGDVPWVYPLERVRSSVPLGNGLAVGPRFWCLCGGHVGVLWQ